MAASPTLKGVFVFLLALSVGGKIIAADLSQRSARPAEADSVADEVAAFFDRHGFRVGDQRGVSPLLFVRATAGDCDLIAFIASPGGFHRNLVRRSASDRDQVLFVFDARTYPDQPAWLTWTYDQWHTLNQRVGRRLPMRPVLGIVASSACDLQALPWREIAKLP